MGETNCSPESLLKAAGLEFNPGRLISIPASAAPEGWPFHELHDFSSAGRFGAYLQQALSPTSGAPISEYLTRLTSEDPESLVQSLENIIDDYENNHRDICVEAIDERTIEMFPVIYATGLCLVAWNILPFTEEDILNAVKFCENSCFYHYADAKGVGDLVMAVVKFLTNNKDKSIMTPQEGLNDSVIQMASTCYTLGTDGFFVEIQILPDRFRREFAHLGPQKVLRACYEAGYLIRDRGSFEKKAQIWPGGDGRMYMYRFRASILEHKARPYLAENWELA